MNLHYRTPDGREEIAVLKEGETVYTATGIPHSPRFPEDAFLLVGERMRRTGETDSFQWFCPSCDAQIHEEFAVDDYTKDPVSQAYANFFDSIPARTRRLQHRASRSRFRLSFYSRAGGNFIATNKRFEIPN